MTTEIHKMFIKLYQLFNNNGNIFNLSQIYSKSF